MSKRTWSAFVIRWSIFLTACLLLVSVLNEALVGGKLMGLSRDPYFGGFPVLSHWWNAVAGPVLAVAGVTISRAMPDVPLGENHPGDAAAVGAVFGLAIGAFFILFMGLLPGLVLSGITSAGLTLILLITSQFGKILRAIGEWLT